MSIAYVASVLPVPILVNKITEWKIEEIVISDNSLRPSYEALIDQKIKIRVAPKNFFINFLFIFFKFMSAKLFNKKIYFFHECCWVVFDLLINLFNNDALFFPQVTMKSFINETYDPKNKVNIMIKLFRQKENFTIYKYTKGNNDGFNIIHSCIKYNNNIIINKTRTTNSLRYNHSKFIKTTQKKALLIIGTEPVSNTVLIKKFNYFVTIFKRIGFEIDIKDHPNKAVRLNNENKIKGNILNPYIPVELIKDDYDVVIGCASTGLLKFGKRSYSIIDMLDMSDQEKKMRKIHLLSLEGGNKINFLRNDFDETIFINKINKLYS